MAKSKKRDYDPLFVFTKEEYDPGYHSAILRKGEDGKVHYFRIDEETSEEYEITGGEAWDEVYEFFMQGNISEVVIPTCERLLESDGWECGAFDTTISFKLRDYHDWAEEAVESGEYTLEEFECFPKTYDDWLAILIDDWQDAQLFARYRLSDYTKGQQIYPNLQDEFSEDRFKCEHGFKRDFKDLLRYIEKRTNDLTTGLLDKYLGDPVTEYIGEPKSEEYDHYAEEIFNEIFDLVYNFIVISPSRRDNHEVINAFKEYKPVVPSLMFSRFLTKTLALLKSNEKFMKKGLSEYFQNDEKEYLDEVTEFVERIKQAIS